MKNKIIVMIMIGLVHMVISGCSLPKVAGGPIHSNYLNEGVYEGKAKSGPVSVIAEVTIQDQRITRINLLRHRNWRGEPAEKTILMRIIEEQSTKVDAVSGATVSSVAIMNAVEDAINNSIEKF